MKYTVKEVLQFVEENDVKFVRLVFFDIFGVKKNVSILSSELENAFRYGAPIAAANIDGFDFRQMKDLRIYPDPNTLKILTWRPQQGAVVRLLCDIRSSPDGKNFDGDVRNVLKSAVEKAKKMDFSCTAGLACQFYLFQMNDNGEPTKIPHDSAGYLDVAPLDKGENVRRQICLTLEQMDIPPLSSHHENGPGQNEIDFVHRDLLSAADDYYTFKSVVKTAAASNGLYASFMPKPLSGKSGSGMHINLKLSKFGENIFSDNGGKPDGLTKAGRSFLAGVLRRSAEMAIFFNPILNSYERFSSSEAPKAIGWGYYDLKRIIRVLENGTERARMDYRCPDPSCNLYLAFSLLIHAGLEGIEDGLELKPFETGETLETLPSSLEKALFLAENSEFIHKNLPELIAEHYITIKKQRLNLFLNNSQLRLENEERYFRMI